MTKTPSVEERVDEVFQEVMTDIGKHYKVSDSLSDILSDSLSERLAQALTAERTAILIELRDYVVNLKGVYSAHDVEEAIKAYVYNLINPGGVFGEDIHVPTKSALEK